MPPTCTANQTPSGMTQVSSEGFSGELKASSSKAAGSDTALGRQRVGRGALSLLRDKIDGYNHPLGLRPDAPATDLCLPGPLPPLPPPVTPNQVDVTAETILHPSASLHLVRALPEFLTTEPETQPNAGCFTPLNLGDSLHSSNSHNSIVAHPIFQTRES